MSVATLFALWLAAASQAHFAVRFCLVPPDDEIRSLFHAIDQDDKTYRLTERLKFVADAAFPAYERILNDPKSDLDDRAWVLEMVKRVGCDRSRFRPYARKYLGDEQWKLRVHAVNLLAQIGTKGDSSLLVAMLSDDEFEVGYAAKEALLARGGEEELTAMNLWLRAKVNKALPIWREAAEARDKLERKLNGRGKP